MRILCYLLGFVLLSLSAPVHADLVHGTVRLDLGPFDFATQSTVSDLCVGDVGLAQIDPPGCTAVFPCWCGACSCDVLSVVAIIEGTTLGEVELAPEDPAAYGCGDCAGPTPVYVVHTNDGLYAKFVFSDWPNGQPFPDSWTIEYVVQTDGSRRLGGVPVDQVTWGAMKESYK